MRSICLVLAFLICPTFCVTADTLIKVRADDWMPMNGEPSAEYPGFLVEILEAVFEPEGLTVDYQLLPWERAIQETRLGKFDCVVGAYKSDVPDFIFPELPWGMDHALLFVQAGDDWKYTGQLSQLKERKLGVVTGYSYGDEFDQFSEDNKGKQIFFVSGQEPLKMNIKKLKAGRLDTILDGEAAVRWKLKQMGVMDYLEVAGELLPPEPLYLACSPAKFGSKRIVDLADKGMLRLRTSGQLKRILDRYGVSIWN